jgi:hypothetical protein
VVVGEHPGEPVVALKPGAGGSKPYKEDDMIIKGWMTLASAAGMVIYGVAGYVAGLHGADTMSTLILSAMGLLGIGRKLDKVVDAVPKATGE